MLSAVASQQAMPGSPETAWPDHICLRSVQETILDFTPLTYPTLCPGPSSVVRGSYHILLKMLARHSVLHVGTVVGLLVPGVVSFIGYLDFPSCEERVLGIIERGESYGDINNVTLEERGYRYHDTIHGLRPPLSSNTTIALTYKGIALATAPPYPI